MFDLFDDPFFDSRRFLTLLAPAGDTSEVCKDGGKQCVKRSSGALAWTPRSDIHETDKAFLIETELPGIPKEAIDVQVDPSTGRITISGKKETTLKQCSEDQDMHVEEEEKKEEKKEKKEKKETKEEEKEKAKKPVWYRMERTYGSFSRSYTLPRDRVDFDNINAAHKDGVLTLSVPKIKPVKAETLKIAIQ